MALTHQRRWMQRVKAITRRKVIFSDHQKNPIVVDMLMGLGATFQQGVYLINGTAGVGDGTAGVGDGQE